MVSTTQTLGRRGESTFNTSAITGAGVEVSYFGKYVQSPGDFPYLDHKFFSNHFGNNNYTDILVRLKIMGTIGYVVANPQFLWYKFGNISGASSPFTLTRRSAGTSLPSYTVVTRDQDSDGSRDDEEEFTGCITPALTLSFDDTNGDGVLTVQETIWGVQYVAPTYTPTVTHPDSDNDHYKRDANMLFTYDTDHEYNTDLLSFAISYTDFVREDIDISDSSNLIEGFIEGTRTIAVGEFTLLRDNDNTLYSEYMTDRANGTQTKRPLIFKIYKNASEYIKMTLTDCSITVKKNYAVLERGEVPVWKCSFRCDTPSIEVSTDLTLNEMKGIA